MSVHPDKTDFSHPLVSLSQLQGFGGWHSSLQRRFLELPIGDCGSWPSSCPGLLVFPGHQTATPFSICGLAALGYHGLKLPWNCWARSLCLKIFCESKRIVDIFICSPPADNHLYRVSFFLCIMLFIFCVMYHFSMCLVVNCTPQKDESYRSCLLLHLFLW